MTVEAYLPLAVSILGVLMIGVALAIVRAKDLVYASISLALLGMLNAVMVAVLGYTLVAVFLIVVYVGAAVMFIIITVSMIGGKSKEIVDEYKGLFTGASVLTVALLLVGSLAAYMGYTRPTGIQVDQVAGTLLSRHFEVIALIFVALAATLVEAIAIARRG